MQIITFQGDLYFPDPPQDSDGGERTRKCAVRNASMIGHRREDCGTRVRDSCARASLPTLPLPGCWPRRGAGQRDLLLRPLRAQRRKDGPQRSRVTDARWDRRRFSLSYASIGSKLLSMPGLRHILDSRLAGVANQNEGQSVLVRAAELINAGAFARF